MKRLILLALVLMFAFVSLLEAADKTDASKAGVWATHGRDICVGRWTYNPFAPNPTAVSSTWTKTSIISGTVTFDGTGAGVMEETFLNMLFPVYTPIPAAPYYGYLPFAWNGNPPIPLGALNSMNWSLQGWPQQPPPDDCTGLGCVYWPYSAGSLTIGKTTATTSVEILPDGRYRSATIGCSLITFGTLKGKYVKSINPDGTRTIYMEGFMGGDKNVHMSSSPVYENPSYDDYRRTVEFYDNYDPTTGEFSGLYGSQEEICTKERTHIRIN